jgi:hypothetical protein
MPPPTCSSSSSSSGGRITASVTGLDLARPMPPSVAGVSSVPPSVADRPSHQQPPNGVEERQAASRGLLAEPAGVSSRWRAVFQTFIYVWRGKQLPANRIGSAILLTVANHRRHGSVNGKLDCFGNNATNAI